MNALRTDDKVHLNNLILTLNPNSRPAVGRHGDYLIQLAPSRLYVRLVSGGIQILPCQHLWDSDSGWHHLKSQDLVVSSIHGATGVSSRGYNAVAVSGKMLPESVYHLSYRK